MVGEKIVSRLALDLSGLPVEREPMYQNLFSLCKTRIEERCGARIVEQDAQVTLHFEEDLTMPDEAYSLCDAAGMMRKGSGS